MNSPPMKDVANPKYKAIFVIWRVYEFQIYNIYNISGSFIALHVLLEFGSCLLEQLFWLSDWYADNTLTSDPCNQYVKWSCCHQSDRFPPGTPVFSNTRTMQNIGAIWNDLCMFCYRYKINKMFSNFSIIESKMLCHRSSIVIIWVIY